MIILADNNKDSFSAKAKEFMTEMFDVGAAAVESAKKGKDRQIFSSNFFESIWTSLQDQRIFSKRWRTGLVAFGLFS